MQQILGRSGANWRPPILCFHDIKLAKTGALCRLDLRGRCREKLSAVRWAAFSPSARNARQEAFNFLAQGVGGHFHSLRSREDVFSRMPRLCRGSGNRGLTRRSSLHQRHWRRSVKSRRWPSSALQPRQKRLSRSCRSPASGRKCAIRQRARVPVRAYYRPFWDPSRLARYPQPVFCS